MKNKKGIILATIILVAFMTVFKNKIIQVYVATFHNSLETYSENLLDDRSTVNDTYGLWKVDINHEYNTVEFMTGSFGLVPSSTYKGFYYSADNSHKVFSVANHWATPLEVNGDYATWTDGTDNHGTSTRIIDKWFWFEASF